MYMEYSNTASDSLLAEMDMDDMDDMSYKETSFDDDWSFPSTSDSNSSSMSFSEMLAGWFITTKDIIFTEVQAEVTRSISDIMLAADMKDSLSSRHIFSLTSDIVGDSLKELKPGIQKIFHKNPDKGFYLTEGITKNVAKNLLIATAVKIQDCLQACTATSWWEKFEDSLVKQKLNDTLPLATAKATGDILQSLLSFSSEGPSNSFEESGSCAKLYNFFQDVADNVTSLVSLPWQAQFPADVQHPEGSTDLTEEPESYRKGSRCDAILKSIIFDSINLGSNSEWLHISSSEDFIVEASTMVSHIINMESELLSATLRTPAAFDSNLERRSLVAASGVVHALMSELVGTLEVDLPNHKTDSQLYSEKVLSVSGNILNTMQKMMKEAIIKDLYMRVNGGIATTDNPGLGFTILSKSRMIVKIIIDNIRAIPPMSDDSFQVILKPFFQSLDTNLYLFLRELTTSELDLDALNNQIPKDTDWCDSSSLRTPKKSRLKRFFRFIFCCGSQAETVSLFSLDMIPEHVVLSHVPPHALETENSKSKSRSRRGFLLSLPKIRIPKLRFKKKKERPVPADLSSEATNPSTTNSAPKPKPFFSRVAAVISKAFRKRSKT